MQGERRKNKSICFFLLLPVLSSPALHVEPSCHGGSLQPQCDILQVFVLVAVIEPPWYDGSTCKVDVFAWVAVIEPPWYDGSTCKVDVFVLVAVIEPPWYDGSTMGWGQHGSFILNGRCGIAPEGQFHA